MKITAYTPDYGPYNSVAKAYGKNAQYLFPDKGGTYTLSDGTTKKASEVISQNQQNAYGQVVPAAVVNSGPTAQSFVGQELTTNQAQLKADQAAQAEADRQRRAQEEAARQADIERQRQQIAQQEADAARQREAAQAEQKRQAEEATRQAALREQQRIAEEQAAQRRALQGEYATRRNIAIQDAKGGINEAFAPFDDAYFNDFQQSFVNYYTPQVANQFDRARNRLDLNFANAGTDNESYRTALGDLLARRDQETEAIQTRAQAAVEDFRGGVNASRDSLLGDILTEDVTGPEALPEGYSDVDNRVSAINSNLQPFVATAKTKAGGVQRPDFSALSDLFSDLIVAPSASRSSALPTNTLNFNTQGIYQPRQDNSVRVVA